MRGQMTPSESEKYEMFAFQWWIQDFSDFERGIQDLPDRGTGRQPIVLANFPEKQMDRQRGHQKPEVSLGVLLESANGFRLV